MMYDNINGYLRSTRYNMSQKIESFFDLKLFIIFFHPYDIKCICGAPSIARGGRNHRHQRDGNRRSTHSLLLPRSLCILGYRDTKACRLKWLPKGKRLRGTWKCRKKFVSKVFSPSMCFMCFMYLPRIHVFLFPPSPLPSIFRSFKSLKIFACVFSTINCVEINFVIVIFETIVWKIFLHTIIYIFRSRIICYSYYFQTI